MSIIFYPMLFYLFPLVCFVSIFLCVPLPIIFYPTPFYLFTLVCCVSFFLCVPLPITFYPMPFYLFPLVCAVSLFSFAFLRLLSSISMSLHLFLQFLTFVRCVPPLTTVSPKLIPPPPPLFSVSVHFLFCSYVLPSILSCSLYPSFNSFLYAVSVFYSHYPFHLHYPFCPLHHSIFTCSLYPAMFLCYALYPTIYPSVLCSSMFLVAIPSLQFFPFSPIISFLCVLAVTLVSCYTSILLSLYL